MKKLFKRLLPALILALCFAACMTAACNDDKPEDTAVAYTVTVRTDATTPASGVTVQIRKGGATFESKTTGAEGKVEFSLVPDDYDVALSKLPEHYSIPQNASLKLTADSRDLTVTLAKNFAYTVKLVNPDGTPFYAQGVMVGICTFEGNCNTPVALGENGIAVIEADPGDYHVQLPELPANYSYECDEHGYYTGKNFSATDTEMTITVYTTASVTSATPMTDAEKKTFAAINQSYNETMQKYVAYKFRQELAANEIAYYYIDPEISGQYHIYTNSGLNYLSNGNNFVIGQNGNFLSSTVVCENGKPYYFKAINNQNRTATAEFVVTVPFSSYIEHQGKGGILDLTVGEAYTNAIIAFTATEAGVYSVAVEGADAIKTIIRTSSFSPDEFNETDPSDSEFKADASVTFTAYSSNVAGKSVIYITVTAKAYSYPVNVKATITKTAAISDTYTTVEVTETLAEYAKPAGKELYGVPMDGSATLVYNATDRFYHFGTADGPVVVVNITGTLSANRFSAGCALAYMELLDSRIATYKFITKNANGESTLDYTKFIRGFDEYTYTDGQHGPVANIPTNITTEKYYAKFVNEDGIYPLTEELKVFLEKFYAANATAFEWQLPMDADLEYGWLFPCFYYRESTVADPIVGEYKFVSLTEEGHTYSVGDEYSGYCTAVANGLDGENKLTSGSSVIRVNKDNTFYVLPYDSSMEQYDDTYESGTWTKSNDGVYTFDCQYGTLTYSNNTFTYDDGMGAILTYKVSTAA